MEEGRWERPRRRGQGTKVVLSRVLTEAVPRPQVMEDSQDSTQFFLAGSMAGFHSLSRFSVVAIQSWNYSRVACPREGLQMCQQEFPPVSLKLSSIITFLSQEDCPIAPDLNLGFLTPFLSYGNNLETDLSTTSVDFQCDKDYFSMYLFLKSSYKCILHMEQTPVPISPLCSSRQLYFFHFVHAHFLYLYKIQEV